jgi:hypothetical protein
MKTFWRMVKEEDKTGGLTSQETPEPSSWPAYFREREGNCSYLQELDREILDDGEIVLTSEGV